MPPNLNATPSGLARLPVSSMLLPRSEGSFSDDPAMARDSCLAVSTTTHGASTLKSSEDIIRLAQGYLCLGWGACGSVRSHGSADAVHEKRDSDRLQRRNNIITVFCSHTGPLADYPCLMLLLYPQKHQNSKFPLFFYILTGTYFNFF